VPNRVRNLLAKNPDRAALADEGEPRWGKMPFVIRSALLPGDTERLARWRSGPAGEVRDTGQVESVWPSSDPGEEVALVVFSQVVRANISN